MFKLELLRIASPLTAILLTSLIGFDHPVAHEAHRSATLSVRKVDSNETDSIVMAASARIDSLIDEKLARENLTRNPLSSDDVFVRRVYLDIVGRIPTLYEVHEFLGSPEPDKRRKLIDKLLDSYGYVSHQYNFFADLLRIKSKHRNVPGQPYIDYIKDSLQANTPYDQMARELIQSQGPMLARENGATGYFLRDLGMPEDNMSNTIRVFLGTRLECAQCHDHPFDRWTQREYYEMLAFTGGMRLNKFGSGLNDRLNQVVKENNISLERQTRGVIRKLLSPLSYGVQGSGTGLAVLPEGFLGENGQEGDIVKAKTIFDNRSLVEPEIPAVRRTNKKKRKKNQNRPLAKAADIGSRDAFADWLTRYDNPRFAKVIANRLWKRAMGIGLIEPVDILEDDTVASNPELMDFLTGFMIEVDFDMKAFLRAIYNSQTYQAVAFARDINNPREFGFPGPALRRLSAEQIWDSLLVLTVNDIDKRKRSTSPKDLQYFGRDIYESYEKVQSLTDAEIVEVVTTLIEKGPKGLQSLSSQAQMEEREYRNELRRKLNSVKKQIKQATRNRDEAALKRLIARRTDLSAKFTTARSNTGLLRASELSSPAPAGHLLREFGQSDREEIDNANDEPSVTQVLSLMNGYIEKKVIQNSNTVLMKNVIWQTNDEDRIKATYLTILSRLPTDRETSIWITDVKNSKAGLSRDLIWTLVNSNEFLFQK